jgi:hypothetical protein
MKKLLRYLIRKYKKIYTKANLEKVEKLQSNRNYRNL